MKAPIAPLLLAGIITLTGCASTYSQHYSGAERGFLTDQWILGNCFRSGSGGVPGGKPDKEMAAIWYTKAADRGHVPSLYNLAMLYIEGDGVPHDPGKAAELLEMAAHQGDVQSQYRLGMLILDFVCVDYECGSQKHKVVAKGKSDAGRWFLWAAERGHVDAQYQLACLYDTAAHDNWNEKEILIDLGGDVHDTKAYRAEAEKWYKKAIEQGHEPAASRYEAFKTNAWGCGIDKTPRGEAYRKAVLGS